MTVPDYPERGMRHGVSGIVDGQVMVCGGQFQHLFIYFDWKQLFIICLSLRHNYVCLQDITSKQSQTLFKWFGKSSSKIENPVIIHCIHNRIYNS